MNSSAKRPSLVILLFLCLSCSSFAFTGTIKFSDEFYAAQKYFYNEARLKFPKLGADKSYPEIPIKGTATASDLKNITALTDFFEARRIFLKETQLYAEQVYPEIFAFLSNHPGLSVTAGNKPKLAALEKYFYPFFYVFSFDKHYSFDADIKVNPCPIVFCLKDEKKNGISFSVSNTSKKNFEFNVTESPGLSFLTVTSKRPVSVKAGSSTTVKLNVDVQKLRKDTAFRIVNIALSDPTQPKVKLLVPLVLLPSKDFLTLPVHFFDFVFSYSTFFKHINLQKEKTSWPERCPNNNCSGKKEYSLRSHNKLVHEYGFGDLCTIQYNVTTSSSPVFNSKNNTIKFVYNEAGSIDGMDRNCPGPQPGTEIHCPPDTPNNGKELYGSRKIEFNLFLPSGKLYELKLNIAYTDPVNPALVNPELSWLQEKKLMVTVTDNSDKQVLKELITRNPANFQSKSLAPGVYKVAIFPVTEDGKPVPSFNLQHLNNGNRGIFDFTLTGLCQLITLPPAAKK
jgi:hypothetical protein